MSFVIKMGLSYFHAIHFFFIQGIPIFYLDIIYILAFNTLKMGVSTSIYIKTDIFFIYKKQ